jgi:hypothetical protein
MAKARAKSCLIEIISVGIGATKCDHGAAIQTFRIVYELFLLEVGRYKQLHGYHSLTAGRPYRRDSAGTPRWSRSEQGGHAAVLSSLSAPRATILSASSGSGLCNALASSHGARIHTSRSSSVVKITGMALGWIGPTIALGAVVKKA